MQGKRMGREMNVLYLNTHDIGRYLQTYGYPVHTPNLLQLSREGMAFTQMYCASPTCSPSRGALLTGQYPHNNGLIGLSHRGFQVNGKHHLANYLKSQGYETVLSGVQHEVKLHEEACLGYEKCLNPEHYYRKDLPQSELYTWQDELAAQNAISYLKQRKKTDRPFFLAVGFGCTHREYPKVPDDYEVDYVIHAAGNAHPLAFNSDPVGTIIGNIEGTYNLLEYTKAHGGKRFLFVSSGEVYGNGDLSLDEFKEEYLGAIDITSPRSCYPQSKRAVENLCASYSSQYELETVVVRPCHTYGPGITETDSRANAQFIRNALNNEDIIMKSAGNQLRSYNYIADCASGLITVLINGKSGAPYNIANPNVRITIAKLAEIIAKAVNKKVIFADPSVLDIANRTPIAKQVLSSKKLENLGWVPMFNANEGVEHTIKILKECE